MRWIARVLCLAVVLHSTAAGAEFYRYVDKDGNVHFTDNPALLPESQRKGLRPYTEFENKSKAGPDEPTQEEQTPPGLLKTPELSPESASNEALTEKKKRLDSAAQDLDLEYRNLVQERNALQEEQKKASKNAIKALNEKILELNQRIEDYKIRRRAHNKAVEQYNAEIQKRNAATREADDAPNKTQPEKN